MMEDPKIKKQFETVLDILKKQEENRKYLQKYIEDNITILKQHLADLDNKIEKYNIHNSNKKDLINHKMTEFAISLDKVQKQYEGFKANSESGKLVSDVAELKIFKSNVMVVLKVVAALGSIILFLKSIFFK